MSGIGIFDLDAISESCWQGCDSDPGSHPIDLSTVPLYRDDDTREQFFEVAAFFGCVDICRSGYERKRILFVAPIAGAGVLIKDLLALLQIIQSYAYNFAKNLDVWYLFYDT